jgi:hypothetical protein
MPSLRLTGIHAEEIIVTTHTSSAKPQPCVCGRAECVGGHSTPSNHMGAPLPISTLKPVSHCGQGKKRKRTAIPRAAHSISMHMGTHALKYNSLAVIREIAIRSTILEDVPCRKSRGAWDRPVLDGLCKVWQHHAPTIRGSCVVSSNFKREDFAAGSVTVAELMPRIKPQQILIPGTGGRSPLIWVRK